MTALLPPADIADPPASTPTLIRTRTKGCFEVKTISWGSYLSSTPDPAANAEITEEQLKTFELSKHLNKIPRALWERWVQLCFHFTKQGILGNVEVSCRLLRKEDDLSQWRILIPEQAVSGAAVRVDSFDKAIDIETGELIEEYPPEGWMPAGSSHSHNTMPAFFSGTDDDYELGDPGVHIVVGNIKLASNTYAMAASITANRRRFKVPYQALIDFDTELPADTPSYHPSVLNVVKAWTALPPKGKGQLGGALSADYHKNRQAYREWRRRSGYDQGNTRYSPYSDPHWGETESDDFIDLDGNPIWRGKVSLDDISPEEAEENNNDGDDVIDLDGITEAINDALDQALRNLDADEIRRIARFPNALQREINDALLHYFDLFS